MRSPVVGLAFLSSVSFATPSVAAAADQIFLTVSGVTGDSQASGFAGSIEASSVSGGVSINSNKPAFSNIAVQAATSSASPVLQQAVPTVRTFANAVIYFVHSGENPFLYLTVTLSDVVVTSFSFGGAAGGSTPTDSFALAYGRIKTEYRKQNPDGSAGAIVTACWDLKSASGCL